jgi:DNA repair protein RecO (recombination protein O)
LKSIESDALLLRNVAYGESDVIATFLTESDGKLASIIRGGRKSTKRVGGALEPFHTVGVRLDDRGGDLATLKEARLVRIRTNIASSLDAIDAAGAALRWARHLCPARTPEPDAWSILIELLDRLDEPSVTNDHEAPKKLLATSALRLLSAVGYGLDLERCIKCGRACPDAKAARIDAGIGGIVCVTCGGGRRVIDAKTRAAARAAQRGEAIEMTRDEAAAILEIVEDAMAAHAGLEP